MNYFRLTSSSHIIVRKLNAADSNWLAVASRLLTVKNGIIALLLCFVSMSVLFPLDSLFASYNLHHVYLAPRPNVTIRVRTLPVWTPSYYTNVTRPLSSNTTINQTENIVDKPLLIWTEIFESEAKAIKESIKKAFLAVNKQIDYCPFYLERLEGSLNVTNILKTIGLSGLVQFHDKSMLISCAYFIVFKH